MYTVAVDNEDGTVTVVVTTDPLNVTLNGQNPITQVMVDVANHCGMYPAPNDNSAPPGVFVLKEGTWNQPAY